MTSPDGTALAYTREGEGPAVVLVGGGLDDGAENAPLATALSRWFTVYNYARRGRGGSGDTPPYALEREIEDLATLIEVAGGRPTSMASRRVARSRCGPPRQACPSTAWRCTRCRTPSTRPRCWAGART